jgi:hypothetical protein
MKAAKASLRPLYTSPAGRFGIPVSLTGTLALGKSGEGVSGRWLFTGEDLAIDLGVLQQSTFAQHGGNHTFSQCSFRMIATRAAAALDDARLRRRRSFVKKLAARVVSLQGGGADTL